jgi:beta-carotene 3-hydroxylase
MAWFTHVWMHVLWNLHLRFQRYFLFFLIYAVPSWLYNVRFYVCGVASNALVWYLAYGIAYFLVHEVFIHQRFKWFRNSDNVYFISVETQSAPQTHGKRTRGVFW